MRSVKSKLLFLSLLAGGILLVSQVFAVEEKPWAEQFLGEFSKIKTRLADVEKAQQDILTQKDKILEDLDQLRVWVRHRGSNPQ